MKGNSIPVTVSIAQFPYITIEKTRAKVLQILTDIAIANGINPTEVRNITKQQIKFIMNNLMDLYITRHAKIHKKT